MHTMVKSVRKRQQPSDIEEAKEMTFGPEKMYRQLINRLYLLGGVNFETRTVSD